MIKKIMYGIGDADETDDFYYPNGIFENGLSSEKKAKKLLKKRLEDWGYDEGWTEEDYDICKITITVERFPSVTE